MTINGIQTNANQASAYPVMQNEVKATDTNITDTAKEQAVSNNTDTFTLSNSSEENTGIYSPDTASVNGTNATSSTTSGSNSYIAKKQRQLANTYGVTLDSNMKPIVTDTASQTAAGRYYAALTKHVNNSVNADYVISQPDRTSCCATSCEMLAKINSNGYASANGTTGVITYKNGNKSETYYRGIGDKTTYSPNQSGFKDYSGLTKEELSNIIVSEIDNGRAVQLHTKYQNVNTGVINEHWVVVTGYTLNTNGEISVYSENGREYITGLSGVDPWPNEGNRTQVTSNLGKNATVSSGGQWLNADGGGYEVRTFKL